MTITNPKGVKTNVPTRSMANGSTAPILFKEPGPHKVEVSFAGTPVKGSPFKVDAVVPSTANNVRAYGPGLSEGTANTPAKFTIDRSAAPPGALGVSVEGPTEAKINCKDLKNGLIDVDYLPLIPGDYKVNVTYNKDHIPGSPFKATIKPSLGATGVKAYGPGLEPQGNEAALLQLLLHGVTLTIKPYLANNPFLFALRFLLEYYFKDVALLFFWHINLF